MPPGLHERFSAGLAFAGGTLLTSLPYVAVARPSCGLKWPTGSEFPCRLIPSRTTFAAMPAAAAAATRRTASVHLTERRACDPMLGGELHRGERPTRRTDLVPPIREQRGEWPSVCASVLRAEGVLVPLDVDGRPLLGVADVLQA